MRMRNRKGRPPLLLAVVAILILLLPVLAYLQYTWLGKVSEREREQMQSSLQSALGRFREDFDQEISRIFREFETRFDLEPAGGLAEEYAKLFAHWRSSAPYPRLIQTMFLEEPAPSERFPFRRFNAT